MSLETKNARRKLITWYEENKRALPWRRSRDPYRIWISEVMLQQTTVTAVIPYYEKFLTRFPTVKSLATASVGEVIEMWAGLGYYSRARNLHKAAQVLAQKGFFNNAAELLELPGFGPYTSRAVASLAFGEPVGVLDGNVIRVLTRYYGLKLKWWEKKEKQPLQDLSDALANTEKSSEVNQGLMELGATICTPQRPLCLMCPWNKECVAFNKGITQLLPLSKPKQQFQMWNWTLNPLIKNDQIFMQPNTATPFLKNMMFPAGKAEITFKKPTAYDIKHGVTKYDIFIKIEKASLKSMGPGEWVPLSQVKKINPTSLMSKILKFIEK
ncbi:MAG: A/G-specific adenine glycosylase [Bdellovibrionaceae bacterium]|nr:A/G-specific adenine glycosylase [Bdellovibrio sp.]